MEENYVNRNENLYACMKKKGVTVHFLSEMTGIPNTTLSRIINNHVKTIKPQYMEAISKALNVPSHTIFSIMPLDQPLLAAIHPEDAGTIITKTLGADESLLLYFYQSSILESRKKILEKARYEAQYSQARTLSKEINYTEKSDNDTKFIQLNLNFE